MDEIIKTIANFKLTYGALIDMYGSDITPTNDTNNMLTLLLVFHLNKLDLPKRILSKFKIESGSVKVLTSTKNSTLIKTPVIIYPKLFVTYTESKKHSPVIIDIFTKTIDDLPIYYEAPKLLPDIFDEINNCKPIKSESNTSSVSSSAFNATFVQYNLLSKKQHNKFIKPIIEHRFGISNVKAEKEIKLLVLENIFLQIFNCIYQDKFEISIEGPAKTNDDSDLANTLSALDDLDLNGPNGPNDKPFLDELLKIEK